MNPQPNINQIYDIVEAALTEITGSRPNATDTDLGLDSLDAFDIALRVEKETGIPGIIEVYSIDPNNMTPLEIAVHLHQVALKEQSRQIQLEKDRKEITIKQKKL